MKYSRTGLNGKARRRTSPEETFKPSDLGVLERESNDTVVSNDYTKREISYNLILIFIGSAFS